MNQYVYWLVVAALVFLILKKLRRKEKMDGIVDLPLMAGAPQLGGPGYQTVKASPPTQIPFNTVSDLTPTLLHEYIPNELESLTSVSFDGKVGINPVVPSAPLLPRTYFGTIKPMQPDYVNYGPLEHTRRAGGGAPVVGSSAIATLDAKLEAPVSQPVARVSLPILF